MNACPPAGRLRRYSRWRRAVQLAVAAFFLALPFAEARGFRFIAGTLASLQIGAVDLIEPSGAAAAALAGLTVTATMVTGAGLLILLGVAVGPVFCSWVCPWGLLSEWLDRARFRGARARWAVADVRATTRLRWSVLGALLGGSLLVGIPLAALVSGPRVITTLPLEIVHLHRVSWATGAVLAGILTLELIGPRRLWCRTLCPAGAAIKLARTRRTLGPVHLVERCADPKVPLCRVACPWGIDPRRMRVSDGCTTCLACVDACGTHALVTGFGPPPMARNSAEVQTR